MIHRLKTAVENQLTFLQKHLNRTSVNDHSAIQDFQNAIAMEMNQVVNTHNWQVEVPLTKNNNDKIDIQGKVKEKIVQMPLTENNNCEIDIQGNIKGGKDEWIIEIDTHRADQVAKKALSRIAVRASNTASLNYVAILYPRKKYNNTNECFKYLEYAQTLCNKSKVNVRVYAIVVSYQNVNNLATYGVTYYIPTAVAPTSKSRVKYKLRYKDKNGSILESGPFGMNLALQIFVQTLVSLDSSLANNMYNRIKAQFKSAIISRNNHKGESWYTPILGTNWLAHTGMWKTTDNSFETLKDLVKEIGAPYEMEIVKC